MPNLASILYNHHLADPNGPAIYLQRAGMPDLEITRRHLQAWAGAYAGIYESHGIHTGEVVILILEHGEPLVYAFFGAALGGQIPSILPFLTEKLSPERYRADLASLIALTQPAAIVTSPEFEQEVRQVVTPGCSVRAVINTGEITAPADEKAQPAGLRAEPEAIALLQHSSGTTGLQKGVALSHAALLNQLEAYRQAIQLVPQDVVVSWLPLYHDMGLIAGFLLPILSGIPLVLMSPFDWVRAPQRLFQAVSQYKGTLSWLPNFAYHFCAQKIRPRHMEGLNLSTWRAVINCSEPVRSESHEIFFEAFQQYGLTHGALHTCYAMAENVFGVTQSTLQTGPVVELVDEQAFFHDHLVKPAQDGSPHISLMSSGRAISGTEIRILDEHGRALAERYVGEIALRSNSMLTGYYHRPDITAKAFHAGWYLTGDFGYISNGELFVTGRKKDLIIVGGKNIYPHDVEALVNQVPGVHKGRAVAFGVFDASQGTETVVVVAEVDDNNAEDKKIISDQIRQVVAKNTAVVLQAVHLVPPRWLVKTSSGKIARSANREKYLAETGQNLH